MREVETSQAWDALKKKHHRNPVVQFSVDSVVLDLASPCQVLGGRNGAGKSQVLRAVRDHIGEAALFIDLHHICEQALMILRSREDFAEMKDEFGSIGPGVERTFDVGKSSVASTTRSTGMRWRSIRTTPTLLHASSGQARRTTATSRSSRIPKPPTKGFATRHDMGLGEFSVHFLFWILEQYRDHKGLTLLLDEPNAYLPPVGASNLLMRLLALCLTQKWKLILNTFVGDDQRRRR